jgi:hypothetical protein
MLGFNKKPKFPEYDIESLDDFMKVPDDRLSVCLSEFAVAVRAQKELSKLTKFPAHARKFRWVDDGKRDENYNITFVNKPEAVKK